MNIGSVFSEVATAVKNGETDLLEQVAAMATNMAKSPNKVELIVQGAILLDTVAKGIPDPKVQMVAQLASAVLTEAQAIIAPAK
jgi:hypothetical protein